MIEHYLLLGFEHVVPLGYDHILFIVSLFLFNSKLKTAVIQCSLFTIAHSITLAMVALDFIQINAAWVEVIIAVSIFIVAFENLFQPKLHWWRLVLVFVFGLIHGMGFASVLQTIGLPKNELLVALLSFNIGVELAQIMIIILCYFLFTKWFMESSWYQTKFVQPVSIGIACVALFLAITRFLSI